MFKRRTPRSYSQIATEMIYPRGGWLRAGLYVLHRLRRLPDQPSRIGRGVAAGVFISFTPFHGFHFLAAAAIAWVIGGNLLAALLATFVGNPITFPFIAYASTWLGREILGTHGTLSPKMIFNDFADATTQTWHNIGAAFGPETARWNQLYAFFYDIYLPYLVGGIILGSVAAMIAHYLTVPVIRAYHRRRARKLAERVEKIRSRASNQPPAAPGGTAAGKPDPFSGRSGPQETKSD
ncbi:MAG: DUF2062 domain-containing protein [Paracoccus sp. (in: a-proteobacteria)]